MNVAIIGTGLIGGSFAYKIKQYRLAKKIFGIDHNAKHLQKALQLKMIDAVIKQQQLHLVDIIVLAVPVNVVAEMLPEILNNILPHQIVIDLSSTKEKISKLTDKHINRKNFVSTHPMWGTEYSGPQAAQHNAFENKICVICDANKSNAKILKIVLKIYKIFGMKMIYMNSKEHDIHTAYISHISHITSFALANTVLEKEKDKKKIFELAGSGFESTVRLAKSSSEMWVPVFQQNKKNVLEVLKEHIKQLQKFELILTKEDSKKMYEFILKANAIKKIIN